MTTVSLILPFHNEGKNVSPLFDRLLGVLRNIGGIKFEIICINDGSKDDTLKRLKEIKQHCDGMLLIDLTRNFGKEAALTAGLDYATGDALVFMDADLQHPPEIIPEMIDRWQSGGRLVVLGNRKSRATDSLAYKVSAGIFYRLHNAISEVEIPPGVGDFRLIDRRVADQLKKLPESRRFMKGLFAWVGYDFDMVEYDVEPRLHGATSFNKWKSWNFALEGLTSFSTAPLRLWTYIGFVISSAGFFYASWVVVKTLIFGVDVPGFASILTAVIFLGGLQLIGIGILGEYIGRIHLEAKRRPVYLVREICE